MQFNVINIMDVKIFLFAFLTAGMMLFSGCAQENETEQQTDTSADVATPDLSEQAETIGNAEFTDLNGNVVDLDDFEGKLVLIDFWESWCGPCLQVFPSMQELREEYPDEFEVLAVTVGLTEGPEDAKAFIEENDYDFTWLYDENDIFEKLGGRGIPFKVYVNPDGELIEIEMGSRGREGDYNSTKSKIQKFF